MQKLLLTLIAVVATLTTAMSRAGDTQQQLEPIPSRKADLTNLTESLMAFSQIPPTKIVGTTEMTVLRVGKFSIVVTDGNGKKLVLAKSRFFDFKFENLTRGTSAVIGKAVQYPTGKPNGKLNLLFLYPVVG